MRRRVQSGLILALMCGCTIGKITDATGSANPAGSTAVAWKFCGTANLPSYFAIRDGTAGTWTTVQPSGGTYSFTLDQAVGGVAYVIAYTSARVETTIYFATATELATTGLQCTIAATGTKTVTGTFAGLAATDQANISIGGQQSTTLAPLNAFSVSQIPDGPVDVLATRRARAGSIETAPTKFVLLRGLNPVSGTPLAVIDFNSTAAIVPATAQATITGAAATDRLFIGSSFRSTGSGEVALFFGQALAGVPQAIYGFPAQAMVAGDLQSMTAESLGSDPASPAARLVQAYSQSWADRTLSFGPLLTVPSITVTATTPVARFKISGIIQAEYGATFVAFLGQGGPRSVSMQATRNYFGQSATTYSLEIPDFPTTSGFNVNWGLRAGFSTDIQVDAFDQSLVSPPTGPTVIRAALAERFVTP